MTTFATLLPLAIGLALSPIPVIELILVLFSKRRVVNSVVFVAALAVFSVIGLALGAAGTDSANGQGDGPSTVTAVVFLVLGLLLLAIGVQNWRNRTDTSEPAVLGSIAGMGPGPVAFLALGATIVNPKNLPLLVGAGSTIADTDAVWLWGLGFVLVATSPYWAAALYAGLGGAGAQARLDTMRAWLIRRNRLIMGVLCLALGAVMVLKGVTAF